MTSAAHALTPGPSFPAVSDAFVESLARWRAFVDEQLIPLEPLLLSHRHVDLDAAVAEARTFARSNGLWLPQIAREHGGLGLSLYEHGLVSEQLGRSLLCQAPDADNMEVLIDYGTDEHVAARTASPDARIRAASIVGRHYRPDGTLVAALDGGASAPLFSGRKARCANSSVSRPANVQAANCLA